MENEMFVNQLKPSGWKLQNQVAVKLKLNANMLCYLDLGACVVNSSNACAFIYPTVLAVGSLTQFSPMLLACAIQISDLLALQVEMLAVESFKNNSWKDFVKNVASLINGWRSEYEREH
ncbi:hypothetical protein J1N35_019805 [Gossypium stocksii]|uniref:Uncharacterized protein n=1 Tax=Gossypium stocksii TaxID=47602 RepID=A0A9D3VDV3_9ROSI|nr:hypothetical protein J1N35_019805 [Gossypium stocksii]